MENGEWNFCAAGNGFRDILSIVGVNRIKVNGNKFLTEEHIANQVPTSRVVQLSDYDDVEITGNVFLGSAGSAFVQDAASGGNESNNLYIGFNSIYNDSATTTSFAIDINSTASGLIEYNSIFMVGGQTTDALVLDPGSCGCVENYVTTAVDRSGHLAPVSTQG